MGSAAKRLGGTRRQSAEGVPRLEQIGMPVQLFDIRLSAFPVFDGFQDAHDPGQPLAAGGTPAAGFPCEKPHQVQHQSHRASPVVRLPAAWIESKSMGVSR